jgi:hypothetical protein
MSEIRKVCSGEQVAWQNGTQRDMCQVLISTWNEWGNVKMIVII